MGDTQRSFIPAAGHDWLLPLYDPLSRWLVGEAIKTALVDAARIESGNRVLDLGCGTGTLTILAQRLHPKAEVIGLDPDPKALAIAKRKSEKAAVSVRFDRGFSDELPYPPGCFDRVFSSFMFHHLTRPEKRGTLRDIRRVLRPGGSLHLLDFGPPRGRYSALLARLLHRGQHLRDNIEGRIPSLMREGGFVESGEVAYRSTVFGIISYYRAIQPEVASASGAV
jgi:ubiquinone/menaquinone biosynthesis C-methylase UbiE